MSKFIVVEGPDRTGKFTQSHLLEEYVKSRGVSACCVEVPIRSVITYRIIYWMLQNGLAKKFPKIFQWFQYLNRKIFQLTALPALERQYDVVIMDRWSLSTVVYGSAEGVDESYTISLSNKLRKPDHTIILIGAAFPHIAEDAYESDHDLQDKVRLGYTQWANNNHLDCTLINCKQDRNVVFKKIKESLELRGLLPRY